MLRVLATLALLAAALWLPAWAFAVVGLALVAAFPWYLEAAALAAVLEGATTPDAGGVAFFPVTMALLAAAGVAAFARPRLARSPRLTV